MGETRRPDGLLQRIDGAERVSGKAAFTGDIKVEGMLYGRIIASLVPHCKIRRVDASEAMKIPGVVAVITASDGKVRWPSGDRVNERLALASQARFMGDCIGAVAGETREACERAASMVQVEYDKLPNSFRVEDSLSERASAIWPGGNIQKLYESEAGEVGKALEESDVVLEQTYTTNRHHCSPLEPAVSLASWEGDELTVHAATQGISRCRRELAVALGIDEAKVRVVSKFKGGGFGNKNSAMDYDIISALLSKRTGRPVLVEYSRLQDFVNVHGRWGTSQRVRTGFKSGVMVAYDVDAKCDIGAYGRHPFGKYVDGPRNLYDCKNVRVKALPVYTNTPATGNMRAPVGVPSTFAFETAMDEAAWHFGKDPVEFRIGNLAELSNDKAHFTSNGLIECIRRGAEIIGWTGKFGAGNRTSKGEIQHGIGMALATWHSEVEPSSATMKLEQDGSVTVSAGIVDIGTGAKTALSLIASESVGIARDQVNIEWGDTGTCPDFIGESGSKTTGTMSLVVKRTSLKLRESILNSAAVKLGVSKDSLVMDRGVIRSKEGRAAIPLRDLASSDPSNPISATDRWEEGLPADLHRASFAAHFCEVDVDLDLGKVFLSRYVAVHDSGPIVNRLTAESQVHGGITMGIGLGLMEELQIDRETGTVLNPSLSRYHIARNDDVPKLEVEFVETDDPYGPKSLGEVPVMPVSPCIGNALFNATGVRLREIPMTSERIVAASRRA